MTMDKLVDDIRAKINTWRSVILLLDHFDGDPTEQMIQCSISGNVEGLKDLLRVAKGRDLGELSIRELRNLAQSLGIKNYVRMRKSVLLSEIHTRRLVNGTARENAATNN